MRLLITVVYCLIVIHGSSSVPGLSKKQEESFSSAQALGQGIPMKNEDVEDAYGQIADKGDQLSLITNVKSQNFIYNSTINPLQKDRGIGNYHSNVLKSRLKTSENSNENTDYSVSRETNQNGVIEDSLNNDPGTKDVVHSRRKREVKKKEKTAKTYRYETEPIQSRFSYIQKIQKINEQKEVVEHKILNEHQKFVLENHKHLEEHNSEETHEHNSRTTSHFKLNKKKRKVKRKRVPQGTKDDTEENEDDESTEEESAETNVPSTKIGSSTATEPESKTNNNSFKSKSLVQPQVPTVAIRSVTKNAIAETGNKTKANKIKVENKQVPGQTVPVLKKKEKSIEEVNKSKDLRSDERSKAKTEKVGSRKSTDVLKSNTLQYNKQLSRQNVVPAEKNPKSVFKNTFGKEEKKSQVQSAAKKYTNINTNNDYGERIVKDSNAAQRLIPSVKQQVTKPKNPVRDKDIYNKPASSPMGLFYERNLKKSEYGEPGANNEFEMDRWRLKVPKATVSPPLVPNIQNVPNVQKPTVPVVPVKTANVLKSMRPSQIQPEENADQPDLRRGWQPTLITGGEDRFMRPERNPFYFPFGPNLSNKFPATFTPRVGNLPATSPLPTGNSKDSLDIKEDSNDDIDNNKTFNTMIGNTSPVKNVPTLSQYISDLQRSISNFHNRIQQSLDQKLSKINTVSTSMGNVNEHNSELNMFTNKPLNQPKTIGNLPFTSNLFAKKYSPEIKGNMDSFFEKYGWRNSRKAINEEDNQSTFRKVSPVTNNLPYSTRSPFRNWPVFAPLHTPTRMRNILESKPKASTSMSESNNNREEYIKKGEFRNSEKRTKQSDVTAETNFNPIKNLQPNKVPLRPFNRVSAPSKPKERYELNSEENKREDIRQSSQKESIDKTTSQKSLPSIDLRKYSSDLNEKLDAFLNQHQQALNNFRSILKLPPVSNNLPEVTIPTPQRGLENDPRNAPLRPLITEDLEPQKPKSQGAPTEDSKKYSSKTNILDSSTPQVPAVTDYRPDFTRPFFQGHPIFNTEALPRMPNPAGNFPSYRSVPKEPENISSTPKIPTTQGNRLFDFPLQTPAPARLPKLTNPNRELGSLSGERFPQNIINQDSHSKEVHDRTPNFLNQHKLTGDLHSVQKMPAVADYRPEVTRPPITFGKLPFFAPLQTIPVRTTQLGFNRLENKFAPLNTENISQNINSNKNFPSGREVPNAADNLPDVTGSPKNSKGVPSSQNFASDSPERFRVPDISDSKPASSASKPHAMQVNRPVFNPPQPLPKFQGTQPSVPNIHHGWPNIESHVPGLEDDTGPPLNIPNFARNLAPVPKVPKLAGNILQFPRTPTPIGHWPVLVPPQPSAAILPSIRRPNAMVVPPPSEVNYPHTLIPTEHGSRNFLNVPQKMGGFPPRPNSPTVKGNFRNIPNLPFTLYSQPHPPLFPPRLPNVPNFNSIAPMPNMHPYNSDVPSIIGRVRPIHTMPTSFYYPYNLNVPMVVGRVRPAPKLSLIRNHQKVPMMIVNRPHLMVGSPFPRNIYPVTKIPVVRKPPTKNRYFPPPKKSTEDEQETLDKVALGNRDGKTIWGIPVSNAAGKIEYLTVGGGEGDMNLITSTDTTGRVGYLYRTRDETGRYHNLHLKPTGGHLSLIESDYFGGKHSTGFIGYDETGEYVVPIHFEGNHHLVIYPYAHSLRYAVGVHPANEIVNNFF